MSDGKNMPNMSAAFRTTEVLGGEKPTFQMVFKFPTMEAMHAADDEWRNRLQGLVGPASTVDVRDDRHGEHRVHGVPVSGGAVAPGLATHQTIEELLQLGYTLKGGLLYPPAKAQGGTPA